jgi:hypothetical protein
MGEAFRHLAQDASPASAGVLHPSKPAVHPLEPFYRRMGHAAISRHGTLWCNAGRFTMVTFPGNQQVAATKREIQQLLVDSGRLAAVFCPVAGTGPVVREYVLHSKDYGLGILQPQFRTHVRKHAKEFVSRELDWAEMADRAAAIHEDLAAQWKVPAPHLTDPRRWADTCATAAATPGMYAYGCLADDALAGYVVAWRDRDTCHGVLIHRNSRFDRQRVGNVLLQSFTAAAIAHADIATINLGRSWYPPKPSLDSFKRHAGYEERDTTLAVVLHPRVESLLRSSFTHRCLQLVGTLTGGRLNFVDDLRLFEAARLTDFA